MTSPTRDQTLRAIANTRRRHEAHRDRQAQQPSEPSPYGPPLFEDDAPTAPAEPTPRQILANTGRTALRVTAVGMIVASLIVASDHTTILDGLLAVTLENAR